MPRFDFDHKRDDYKKPPALQNVKRRARGFELLKKADGWVDANTYLHDKFEAWIDWKLQRGIVK